jgi:hypothetical protein
MEKCNVEVFFVKIKSASYVFMRTVAFGFGITFPFVSLLWKIIILILVFMLRIADIDRDRNLIGVPSLFFLGMILSYLYKLIYG